MGGLYLLMEDKMSDHFLVLQHVNGENFEWWDLLEGGKIHVRGLTPTNYPQTYDIVFTFGEAVRQYLLLTSQIEGWIVIEGEKNMHDLVEKNIGIFEMMNEHKEMLKITIPSETRNKR